MASQQLWSRVLGLFLLLFAFHDVSTSSSLHRILKRRDALNPPSRATVAIPSTKAQEFLGKLSRTKRNIWDRSRADVQQWIQQFMYLGFDEQSSCYNSVCWCVHVIWPTFPEGNRSRLPHLEGHEPEPRLEADLSYWMDQARSNNQGRQHHYDENSPTGPRDPSSYRYGADVNYDYY